MSEILHNKCKQYGTPYCKHWTPHAHVLKCLMMGTWLPETCWATIRREIKNAKSDILLVFLIHTELHDVHVFVIWYFHQSISLLCGFVNVHQAKHGRLEIKGWIYYTKFVKFYVVYLKYKMIYHNFETHKLVYTTVPSITAQDTHRQGNTDITWNLIQACFRSTKV